jgi:hypothetical protein
MSRTLARLGLTATLALVGTTLAVPTAHAVVKAPANLSVSPEGASVPVMSWSQVPKATSYQVQVDTDSTFGSPDFSLTTANFRATPTSALRAGQHFWRVRAVKGNDTSAWQQGNQFTVSPINVPVPLAPIDGVDLAATTPPLLTWQGSPSAVSYTVEVDADSDFVGATSYSTKSTSLVVPDPLGAGDWFWRVTAVRGTGQVSLPSAAATFDVLPLDRPTLVSPTDSVDTKIGDVVLDWAPLPGARTYDVEVSDGPTFDPARTTRATGVQGTSFSPRVTLNNDQFWWRVRGVDLNGQATAWAQTNHGFNRAWEDQPQPVHPLGSPSAPPALNTNRPFYQWTAVPKATVYELAVASDVNFSSQTDVCRVVGTTYAPRDSSDCGFKESGTTYWKVRPIDKPYNSTGLPGQFYSPTQAFVWGGSAPIGAFTAFSPVTGMKVSVNGNGQGCTADDCQGLPSTPVFSWDPQPGITRYAVYIGQDAKFTTSVLAPKSIPIVTTNTMLTLRSGGNNTSRADEMTALPDSDAGKAYHWYVRPCTDSLCGPDPLSSNETLNTKSFVKASPAVTGLRSGDPTATEITFNWDDYHATNNSTRWNGEVSNQSAQTYRIQVDNESSFQAPVLDSQVVDQTTYTALDRLYPEGTLYWRVQALDEENNGLTWSSTESLVKSSPPVALQSPVSGAVVPGTTPFRWAPQAFAASYTLEVYKNNDRSFSSVNRLFSTTVKTAAYAWNQPVPADATPYVWCVRRTDADGNPGPWSAAGTFTSTGAAPVLTGPADGSWQPSAGTLLSWTDVPGAANYTLTVTSGTASRASSITTSGTFYATTKALETGTYSWSVAALDSAGKVLGRSATRTFRADSTAPTLVSLKGKKLANKKKAKFVAKFSEPVKGVSKRTVKLKAKGSKKAIKTRIKVKGSKVIIKPKVRLKRGKTYLITWKKGIKDAAGNALVQPKKSSFTIK